MVRSTCTTVSWPASILSSGTKDPQPAAKSENDSVGSAAGTVRRAVRCCAGGSKRALRAQGGTVSGACTRVVRVLQYSMVLEGDSAPVRDRECIATGRPHRLLQVL